VRAFAEYQSNGTTTAMVRPPSSKLQKEPQSLEPAPRRYDWSLKSVIASVAREVHRPNHEPGNPSAINMFRLLPPLGFWWPVRTDTTSRLGRERYRPPLDPRDCQCVVRGITRALRLGSDGEHRALLLGDRERELEGTVWVWGVTKEVLERAMVLLVVAATEVVEEAVEADIYEDPTGFVMDLRKGNETAWFAHKEVRPGALVKLLRLAMMARQGHLERLKGGTTAHGERETLANAVDGLINVVECRFAENVEVMDKHFEDVEGLQFVEMDRLEEAWRR